MIGRRIRIGSGAGFSGDRIEPAIELLEHGQLDYLAFECLAERTIGLAQAARQIDPAGGFDPLLDARMRAAMPIARQNGVGIISNMGAANPLAAARTTTQIARELGLTGYRTAAVLGDDVLDLIMAQDFPLIDRDGTSRDLGNAVVSANAYLGVDGIVTALGMGADAVLTGRVCDPALFLAPLVHAFGWSMDDWDKLGQGTMIGHLLECAGQLCGGYFADPGVKDIPDLARLGFPFADVDENGRATFGKLERSGGALTEATCKEQLLYEILDPAAYLQADVVADFTGVRIAAQGRDRVEVIGATGTPRPDTLKVSICYEDGFIGEGQISYAGPGAVERGRLALDIVRERLRIRGMDVGAMQFDLIGIDAVDRRAVADTSPPREVRVRVAGRADTLHHAESIGAEVDALYTNGPMGGGGVSRTARKVLAVASTLIDRDLAQPRVEIEVA
ncbi:MAG: acyclic terpene utilization AtuA family protein [Novosphingobium sp.]|uniref:acyclic terpene utilization AtuA family protein n=1 Tax=Novosphingobium sp. TaxID=1874826 RepID=UPI003B9C879C